MARSSHLPSPQRTYPRSETDTDGRRGTTRIPVASSSTSLTSNVRPHVILYDGSSEHIQRKTMQQSAKPRKRSPNIPLQTSDHLFRVMLGTLSHTMARHATATEKEDAFHVLYRDPRFRRWHLHRPIRRCIGPFRRAVLIFSVPMGGRLSRRSTAVALCGTTPSQGRKAAC